MGKSLEINLPANFNIEDVVEFRAKINDYIEQGTVNFIFDFSKCNFIDSTGLGALVSVYKKCVEKNGSIILRALRPEVRELFKLTRLDKVFQIER